MQMKTLVIMSMCQPAHLYCMQHPWLTQGAGALGEPRELQFTP